MTPPIKRGTARRLGLRLPDAYRQRYFVGFDPASSLKDFALAATVPLNDAFTGRWKASLAEWGTTLRPPSDWAPLASDRYHEAACCWPADWCSCPKPPSDTP